MSHKHPLRKDKTCLNCNYVVNNRFCSNCGQENTDTRKSFHHLFLHFFEDLTHYENAFWKTIKNLITKPGELTTEYLSGKRMSYLAPVRLYIFISFVTFLVLGLFGNEVNVNSNDKPEKKNYTEIREQKIKDSLGKYTDTLTNEEHKIIELQKKGVLKPSEADTLLHKINVAEAHNPAYNTFNIDGNYNYKSIKQLDSVRKADPNNMGTIKYWFYKKFISINKKYTKKEITEKFIESIKHNYPKTLFFYMPLFAFVLWLFHNKKKWYYFDHGIFTLHYFSFLLLMVLIEFILTTVLDNFDSKIFHRLSVIITFLSFLWIFYYFFPAHHRFYGETKTVSFFKSFAMLFSNTILLIVSLLLLVIYSIVTIH